MKKIFVALLALLALPIKSQAFCPICTVAVGAGLGLAEWLGIDDSISGLWIGAFTVSLIAWTISWFNKKNIRFKGRKIAIFITYYFFVALALIPLYYKGSLGNPKHSFWKLNNNTDLFLVFDKIIVGIVLGSILFFVSGLFYEFLKKKNNGRAHFPFEKIVISVGILLITTAVFYFLTK